MAEAFYWTGRYLERAHNLAVMIGVIESLELEELNLIERTLYRPVWDRILPPLENPGSVSRRNISSPAGRYRLDARSGSTRLRCPSDPAGRRKLRIDLGMLESGSLERAQHPSISLSTGALSPAGLAGGAHSVHPPVLRLGRQSRPGIFWHGSGHNDCGRWLGIL